MLNKGLRTCAILLAVVLSASIAYACRFTVRDIGFVELRGPEYSLVATLSATDAGSVNQTVPANVPVDNWLAELRRQLADSNVQLSIISSGESNVEDVAKNQGQRIASLKLLCRDGRSLDMTDSLPSALTSSETSELTSSDTSELTSSDTESSKISNVRLSADEWLGKNLFSETLDDLGHAAINSFVQIVVIDGLDPQRNFAAREVAQQAVQAIRKIEPMLPRPIAFPVRVRQIEYAERKAERVLLWGAMGSTETTADTPNLTDSAPGDSGSAPMLMVLYGRGRLAGPAMSGDSIELRETLAQLALVGESCECETDRAWLDERVIPFRWSSEVRKQASTSLGFDPDSPLVQAEMTRIVSQGFNSARVKRKNGDGRDDIERLLIGYAEAELTPYLSDPTAMSADTSLPATSALSPVRAQIVSGDGWDFEEPTTRPTDNVDSTPPTASDPMREVEQSPTQPSTQLSKQSTQQSHGPPRTTQSTTTSSGFSSSLLVPVGITLGVLFVFVFVSGLLLMGRMR